MHHTRIVDAAAVTLGGIATESAVIHRQAVEVLDAAAAAAAN